MKRIILFVFAIVAILQKTFAYDFSAIAPTGQTLYYYIIGGNEVVVTYPSYYWGSYSQPTGSLTIPNSVSCWGNSYSVTQIGHDAFHGCSGLTSVTIPNSVTQIGSYAFYGCSGMTSVTIGSSVTQIGQEAFYGCSGLTSVTIPNSVTNIGGGVFYGCSGLTSVTIPNSVTTIGNSAFYGCSGLSSVTIPNSVTQIGYRAFAGCGGLTTVYFNADSCSAGSFEANPFYGDTNISTINFGNSVSVIPSYLCYGLSGLTSVTIPNSVTHIGNRAFAGCSGLTTLNFNADSCYSVCTSYYNNSAFYGDTNISTINFGNSVTIIPSYLCRGLSGLTSVTIPNSVTHIGDDAFTGCSGLTTVNFNANSCYSAGEYYNTRAFDGDTNISTINIGNSVTIIPSYLCYGLSGLTSVTIPNSVTRIGEDAFTGCSGLTTVNFNADSCSTSGSGNSPFMGDTNISTINFGNSVTIIPSYLCRGLSGLTTVTIPNSVTTIGSSVFYGCTRLDTVWLLPNVPPLISYVYNLFPSTVDCFFVSCEAYSAYYSTSGWIGYRNRLQIYNLPNFIVNVLVNNTAFGTATIIQQVNNNVSCDSLCIIRAMSNYGFHFDHWSNGRTSNPDTLHIVGDSTIVAYFAPNQYSVEGMSYYFDRGYVSGSDTVDYLDTVVLTATAYYGYRFDHWSDGAYENPHSVVAIGDSIIWAYFTPVQFSLSVASADENMGIVYGGGFFGYQSNRTIRATANYGYHFAYWNDGDANSTRTITLTQDTSFTAYFAPNRYTLSLQSADETLGIVNGGGEYNYHDTVTISATAIASHYHFESWSDNNTDNPRQVVVSGDIALTADFSINVYDVVLEVDSLIHGTVSGDGSYTYGTAATVTATPYSGWEFSHWSDGATYNPYTFAVLQDTVLTAFFVVEGSQNGIDGVDTIAANIYVTNGQIVVEGAEGYPVCLYDVVGRLLATRRETAQEVLLDVPASGAYLVKIGDAPARRIVVRR